MVEKSGAYYRFQGKNIAQGREKVRAALEADAKLSTAITELLKTPATSSQRAA